MNLIHGDGIWESPKDADGISPLNRKIQSLAQELFCTWSPDSLIRRVPILLMN